MAVVVPNALALASIADGAAIVASDHRNNYSAVQVGVNGLIAMFTAAPTKGDLIVSAGAGSFDRLAVGSNGQAVVADSTQPLGVKWAGGTYRKTTAKTVNTTVAATDLLNGEVTIAAGQMSTDRVLRLTAWGDWLQNSGGTVAPPRFQAVFGGTTLLDTGISGTVVTGATRNSWRLVLEIENLGLANSQMSHLDLRLMNNGATTQVQNTFTTGEGILTSIAAAGQVIFGEGINPATAVDTALAKLLALNVINASASATYETKLLGALVEIL